MRAAPWRNHSLLTRNLLNSPASLTSSQSVPSGAQEGAGNWSDIQSPPHGDDAFWGQGVIELKTPTLIRDYCPEKDMLLWRQSGSDRLADDPF
jgi:hypothetical protein